MKHKMNSIRRQLFPARSTVEWYSGGLFGVGGFARQEPYEGTLGGRCFREQCGAWRDRCRGHTRQYRRRVMLEEPLKGVLQRRFVAIRSARYDSKVDSVIVKVKLPAGLGTQTIVLRRK